MDLAAKSAKAEPKPLPRQAQAEQLAEPHLAEARNLISAAGPVLDVYETFSQRVDKMTMFEIIPVLRPAFTHLTSRLDSRLQDELLTAFDPVAQRVLKKEKVKLDTWPELDAIGQKYDKSLDLIEPYLPLYQDSLIQTPVLLQFIADLLRQLKDPRRKLVRVKLVALKDVDFQQEMKRWRDDVTDKVQAGEPFNPRKLKTPKTILETYKRKAVAIARQTK
jgi:hypothetical protein